MSTQLTTIQPNQFAVAREMDNNTWNAIKEIYDGASDEKIGLVIDYCKARKLDPLKKPVHIVPVWSNRRKCMVETIWPSVAEVRITAMRTGAFVRQDATQFGPDITRKVGNVEMTFPEFAIVTVYRLVGGESQPFHGPKVRWMETYSNKGRDDASPNSMWAKRPYGQLEKCAEAAALRRAFPEEGSYTAEEMHGKELDESEEIPGAATGTPPPDRPAPKPRATRGAAAAKAAEVIVPAEDQKAEDIQQAMKAREEKLNEANPEPVKEAVKDIESKIHGAATAAVKTSSVTQSRTSLKDGETVELVSKVESFQAIPAKIGGVPVAAIKAVLSGGFAGEVRQKEGGAKFNDDGVTVSPLPPWQAGLSLKFKLRGTKNSAGAVIVWVDSVSSLGEEMD